MFNEGKHPTAKGIGSLPKTNGSYETLQLPGTFQDCGFSSSFVSPARRRVLPAEHYLFIRLFLPSVPRKETAQGGGNCCGWLLPTREERKGCKAEIAGEHSEPHRSHGPSPGCSSATRRSWQHEAPCNGPGSHKAQKQRQRLKIRLPLLSAFPEVSYTAPYTPGKHAELGSTEDLPSGDIPNCTHRAGRLGHTCEGQVSMAVADTGDTSQCLVFSSDGICNHHQPATTCTTTHPRPLFRPSLHLGTSSGGFVPSQGSSANRFNGEDKVRMTR